MKHTPGPWKWTKDNLLMHDIELILCRGASQQLTIINPKDKPLIAAAPDLLEACKYALDQIPHLSDIPFNVIEKLKQAIAKAEPK